MNKIPFRKNQDNRLLSRKQHEEVHENLFWLAEKLNITAVLLVNGTGQLIAEHHTKPAEIDKLQMTTITAGNYSAAKEIARLIGENANFEMILHEGKKYNLFIAAINPDYFLIVLSEKNVAVGMVRLFTKKTVERLFPVLSGNENNKLQMDQMFNQRFQTLLNDKLERSFKEKK